MLNRFHLKHMSLAVLFLCSSNNVFAQSSSRVDVMHKLRELQQRMIKLELRNAELEQKLQINPLQQDKEKISGDSVIEQRLKVLEAQQLQVENSLEKETISEKEPDLTARLKSLETLAINAQSAARKVEVFDGITAGLSLTTVAQKPYGITDTKSQLNYRGDAFISLPLASIGDIDQNIFVQFRLGQGVGLNGMNSFSKPNASAFRVLGIAPDDSVAVLGQAWYQATIPLPFGGYKPHSKESLEVNFGKIDPFVFFDQNAAAGDETLQFLNSAFVHNPLLDAGGDIGVDANGFTPGLRLSYSNVTQKPQTWRVSLGVFGAGEKGANYERSLSSPLLMLQAETEQRMLGGLVGNYRIYAWNNPQSAHFDDAVIEPERHSGWGISVDQRVGDGVTLFGRYGQLFKGHASFDRAVTLGAEINGSYWSRGADRFGFALGWLKTSKLYRALNVNNAFVSDAERVAELYYSFHINKQFQLSPGFQYIDHPAANDDAKAVKVLGLRAQITY